eukprot:COSAG05_NODE_919_length_6591_cov_81.831793_4_plen_72_part_00
MVVSSFDAIIFIHRECNNFVFIYTLVPPLRHSALYVFRPFHGSSSEATVFYALCSLDLCTCDIYICISHID